MIKILWILSAFCLLFVVVGCMENDAAELDETERETGTIVETPEQPSNDPGDDDFEDTVLPEEDDSESTTESENPPEPPAYLSPGVITATEWVAAIRMGWSLGNTLDAHGNRDGFPLLGGGVYANTTVTELETGWNRPVTTKAHFTALKDAGFNAIRIPVTWYKACDADLNIREDWMARVKEVVGYAVENDMFIILNTHHDDVLFMLGDDEIEESKRNIERIWEQIADTFKDHGLKLAFEGLNEPRTIGSPEEWRGGTEEERANLNLLNQVFVDTVRSTVDAVKTGVQDVSSAAAQAAGAIEQSVVGLASNTQENLLRMTQAAQVGLEQVFRGNDIDLMALRLEDTFVIYNEDKIPMYHTGRGEPYDNFMAM